MTDIQKEMPKEIKEHLAKYPDTQDLRLSWILHQQELIEQLQENFTKQVEGHKYTAQLLSQQMQENKRLREALEWYADHRNHPPLWVHDGGEKARQALSPIKGESNEL